MTVKITKPALNLREELASLRNQGGAYEESKFYLDNLVTNGDFSNGLSGWTSQVAGFTVTGGEAVGTSANGLYPQIGQTFKADIGKTYKVVVGKAQINSGFWVRVRVSHGGTTETLIQNNSSGSNVNMTGDAGLAYFTAKSSEVAISLEVRDGAVGTFDNVSVQEVGENLVTNGTFDNGTNGWFATGTGVGTWSVSSGSVSQSGQTSFSAYLNTPLNLEIGKTYTISFDITQSGNGNTNVGIGTNHSGVTTAIVWQDGDGVGSFSATFVATSSTHHVVIQEGTATVATKLDNFLVTEGNHPVIQSIPYGYEVKDVYIDGELAREGEAYDYEVKTDGINQWLKPSVEPTATTETVVIGVRK